MADGARSTGARTLGESTSTHLLAASAPGEVAALTRVVPALPVQTS